jgi:hypothetical protein
MNIILEQFKKHGDMASFHYADDSASGEWRLGHAEEQKALELFDANPELQNEMREIAKGFLWTLELSRPMK